MISANRAFDLEPLIDIKTLKSKFPQYYKYLYGDELQPNKIVLCSNLILKKDDTLEKILLVYKDRFIIIKSINGNITKYIIEYKDIDYIVSEGMPNPSGIAVEYRTDARERIFYDAEGMEIVNTLLLELRKNINMAVNIIQREGIPELAFSDMEAKKYAGAVIANNALLDKASAVCSIKQKRIYTRVGYLFRRTLTQTHFTIVCKREIVIFREKGKARTGDSVSGDLMYIPLGAIKNVSIEATGKGMILKYLFNSNRKLELYYENERTDQLLKLMSYLNGQVSK